MANVRNSRDRSRDGLVDVARDVAKQLRDLRRWWLQAAFASVLVVLGVTVAVMTNPATTSPTLPLSDEDEGKVATADIRAPISFSVPDVEATDRKRTEAEAAIRSVYDFEQELGQEKTRRLREAFGQMQRLIREHEAAAEALGGESTDDRAVDDAAAGDKRRVRQRRPGRRPISREAAQRAAEREEEQARLRKDLQARLDERKGEFLKALQIVVNDEDFARLKADRFSTDTLNGVSSLVERTMRHMIVSSRELLAADRLKGITVRFLRDGVAQRELVVVGFSRILDAEEASLRVEQTAALQLSSVSASLRATQIRVAKALVTPNMLFNRPETKRRKREARENVQPLERRIQKGTKIIRDGDLVEKSHIRVFQEMAKLTEVSNAMQMALGTVLLVAVALFLVAHFSARNIRKFRTLPQDLALLALVMFVSLVSVKLWFWIFGAVWEQFRLIPLESYYFAIPFAAGAMLVRFVLNSEMALSFTAVFAILAGLVMDASIGWTVYCLVSSLVAASAVGNVRQRTSLLHAGVVTGSVNMLLAAGMSMLSGGEFFSFQTVFSTILAFSGGILAAVIVTGVAPLIEVVFGYTTDIKLLELANLNHPLLKDLIVQAPGSYHHSIIVGSMVEAAAESIHCNPLLARVMAYYHDIGKIKKPAYFSENQRDGINRHDKLKPSLSASVLRAHVKDGAELAREYRLGQPIVDAIVQHHGTSLMKFFYQRAKDQAEDEDTVEEADFRYHGPRPQMREVALVMLADSVEAAAKSISDPSPARLQGLVQNIINRIFVDGQLDECDLTLKDLHEIARAFNRVLAGIYHHRPDYPEPATREREPAERKVRAEGDKDAEGRVEHDEKRQETPDDNKEDIKRLGI